MTNLIAKIETTYNAKRINNEAINFSSDDNDFSFVDGTLYQNFNGHLGSGCKKVKTIKSVEKFVSLRA